MFGNLGKVLLEAGDTLRAVEVIKRGIELVPPEKLPHIITSVSLAEGLLRSGNKEEGEKLLGSIINYSKEYLNYALSIQEKNPFGMDYPTGLAMQSLLDIYKLAISLEDDAMISMLEPVINNYYGKLYSGN
jgi:hypothetical protein